MSCVQQAAKPPETVKVPKSPQIVEESGRVCQRAYHGLRCEGEEVEERGGGASRKHVRTWHIERGPCSQIGVPDSAPMLVQP